MLHMTPPPHSLLAGPVTGCKQWGIARAVRQALGVKRDLFGLLPGRQTFVFDRAGRNALVFRSQLNAEQHIAEALKVVKTLA